MFKEKGVDKANSVTFEVAMRKTDSHTKTNYFTNWKCLKMSVWNRNYSKSSFCYGGSYMISVWMHTSDVCVHDWPASAGVHDKKGNLH